MLIPEPLRSAIEEQLAAADSAAVLRAARDLSERYRRGEPTRPPSREHHLAYALARLPATYAAIHHALAEAAPRLREVRHLLDLGGGPGTTMWAAAEVFPSLEAVTIRERDADFAGLGRSLAAHSRHAAVRNAEWQVADISHGSQPSNPAAGYDLAVLAYALGELKPRQRPDLLRRIWTMAESLVIVEPGTPRNFAVVLEARSLLLESGAHLAAPCPRPWPCPMAEAGDWCHFSARVERTSLHRLAKGGSLGYEDEKFSYLAAMKTEADLPRARIVRHPLKHPGHVQLTLCTEGKLERETVAKSQKERYRAARKAEWGDAWE